MSGPARDSTTQLGARLASSFRDPSGFVFRSDGQIYRQINERYRAEYERLLDSGLYDELVTNGLLVSQDDAPLELRITDSAFKIVKPEPLWFISYPYEWCFGQLKTAALLTLEIQRRSLERGMVLKDATAYNVQFDGCQATFIDLLSFETYIEGAPWIAYQQFCQHFLAPLALMSKVDVRASQWLRVHLDGIPLDLASALLPFATKLRPSLLAHIHAHAKSQKRYASAGGKGRTVSLSKRGLIGIVESLRSTVESLRWEPAGTEWADYYEMTNYDDVAMKRKEEIVDTLLSRVTGEIAWDLGANAGRFSRIARDRGLKVVAFDVDPSAVEKSFRQGAAEKERRVLPLVLDLTNPSGGIGWECSERSSLPERGPADVVLALALVHHLAIGNNVPLPRIAAFLRGICQSLVIEFIPKEDSQCQRLLASREDIFDDYDEASFRAAFEEHFEIEAREEIAHSTRAVYLMRARKS